MKRLDSEKLKKELDRIAGNYKSTLNYALTSRREEAMCDEALIVLKAIKTWAEYNEEEEEEE